MTTVKKNGLLALIMAAMLAMSMVALTACSNEGGSAESSTTASTGASSTGEAQITVGLTISSPAADESVTFNGPIIVDEGASPIDVLLQSGLDVNVENGSYGAFITSIDGLANEGTTGWTYTVNSQSIQSSAETVVLQDGETVEWSYVDMADTDME